MILIRIWVEVCLKQRESFLPKLSKSLTSMYIYSYKTSKKGIPPLNHRFLNHVLMLEKWENYNNVKHSWKIWSDHSKRYYELNNRNQMENQNTNITYDKVTDSCMINVVAGFERCFGQAHIVQEYHAVNGTLSAADKLCMWHKHALCARHHLAQITT